MKNIIDIKIGKDFERISKKVTEWVKNIEMNMVYNRAGKVTMFHEMQRFLLEWREISVIKRICRGCLG